MSEITGIEQLVHALNSLEKGVRNGAMLKALRKGGETLQRQTQAELVKEFGAKATDVSERWRKPMTKGVTVKTDKAYQEVSVSIRGDVRNIWFELGTRDRYLKRTGAKDRERGYVREGDKRYLYRKKGKERMYRAGTYRGRIKPREFFAKARANEGPVIDAITEAMTKEIDKLLSK